MPLRSILINGGEGGIRTHGAPKGTTDFESAPFDHSGTSPEIYYDFITNNLAYKAIFNEASENNNIKFPFVAITIMLESGFDFLMHIMRQADTLKLR